MKRQNHLVRSILSVENDSTAKVKIEKNEKLFRFRSRKSSGKHLTQKWFQNLLDRPVQKNLKYTVRSLSTLSLFSLAPEKVIVMLVTLWIINYNGDRFVILVILKCIESVINISNLSPTSFVCTTTYTFAQPTLPTRIPPVKLKIPGKAFLKSESRISELLLHSSYSFWP